PARIARLDPLRDLVEAPASLLASCTDKALVGDDRLLENGDHQAQLRVLPERRGHAVVILFGRDGVRREKLKRVAFSGQDLIEIHSWPRSPFGGLPWSTLHAIALAEKRPLA